MSNKELVKSRVLLSNMNALFTTTNSYLTPLMHMALIIPYIVRHIHHVLMAKLCMEVEKLNDRPSIQEYSIITITTYINCL